jgi:hypothetical protein
MDYNYLKSIIQKKDVKPTIINEESNFVVSTYWWGRGNFNQNTARPCILFYEEIFGKVQRLCVEYLSMKKSTSIERLSKRLEYTILSIEEFKTLIENRANAYNGMIFEDLGIDYNDEERHRKAKNILERKTNKTVPEGFKYKNKEIIENLLTVLMIEFIALTKENITKIALSISRLNELKKLFTKRNALDNNQLKEIENLNAILQSETALIKDKLKLKKDYTTPTFKKYAQMSLYDIMNKEMRYLNPIKYDEMIELWEAACKKSNCNFMTIEYPEFAKPGGYQLAINAKPLFIKKALESTGKRSVLYIDGDMYIRKYPKLFDLTDVDFMGRGWNIDPRASWKMSESITYDPYTFETSGGTMWFSQNQEAKNLIDYWVNISSDPSQAGKADDRLLGLIFNENKLLCSMKIIQLPIEYLWLTLDYDELMLDTIYDYNKRLMKKSILIEHSECLTSEDTAASGGASSDRTPANYKLIELNIDPVSEQFHEYIYFPSADMVDTLKHYLEYMNGAQYFSDGNPILERKGLISKDTPDTNEQPLYITKYKDKYGKTKYFKDDSLTWNEVAKITTNKAKNMNINALNLSYNNNKAVVEINNFSMFFKADGEKIDNTKIISLIIRLLNENKTVIYNPTSFVGYNGDNYTSLFALNASTNNSLELIFTPEFSNDYESESMNFFYKPLIQTNQPILFKPTTILIKFLTMFLSLDDFSKYLNYGSYEFISRVRVGYNIYSKETARNIKGGSYDSNNSNNYNKGIEILYNKNHNSDNKFIEIKHNSTKRVKFHNNRKTRKIMI